MKIATWSQFINWQQIINLPLEQVNLYQYNYQKQVSLPMKKYPQNINLYQPTPKHTIQLRSKRKTQQPIQVEVSKMKMDFKYNFQDYIKMALSKLIPHEGIIIDVREGFIYGERDECIKLKKKVQKEFTSKKYKKIEFKIDVDFDEIQYQLHPKFQAHIFRPGFIDRALTSLSLYDSLEYSCQKFREIIKNKRTIILRLKSDYEEQCMQKIEQILKKNEKSINQKRQNPQKDQSSNKMQDQSYQQVIDEESNYYQVKERQQTQLNQSHITIDESQFNLTQTNSSQLMDEEQEQDLSITQCQIVNRSYM